MAQEIERVFKMPDDVMLERAQVFHDRLTPELADFSARFPWLDPIWLTAFQNDITAADAFPKDESVTLDIKVLTGDVLGAMQQGYAALQTLGGYAKLAWPKDLRRQRVFGQDNWGNSYSHTLRLQEALELAFAKADDAALKPGLLGKGYTQVQIDQLNTLAMELQTKNGLQEAAKAGRKVTSQDRIGLLNIVWDHMRTVNICASVVWANDAGRREQYQLYPSASPGDTPAPPPPPPPAVQPTNLTGQVRHSLTNAPLFNVEVTVMRTIGNVTVFTDAGGNYAANAIPLTAPENVQVRFRLGGFDDRLENITLVPGVNQVLNVTMTPPPLPPPPPPAP